MQHRQQLGLQLLAGGSIVARLDDGFGDADIIIEAVFENLALKKEIAAVLDRLVKPEALIATNTSTLDIDEIAAATNRPSQVRA